MSEKKTVRAVLTPLLQDCNDYCICQRYASDVFCENAKCTFSGHGRVQRPCNFHPSQTYLLDLSSCPFCQSKCVEIFIPSVVGTDKRSRREPHKEELMDCKAREIIPFISYEQQPYVKEQEMLTEIYSKKLPKEEYSIWKETMRKRCFIIKKKYQLLVKQESLSSPDLVPKITMADLEKMRDDLYEASKFERDWRRSTAALKSVDSSSPTKFAESKGKPSSIHLTSPTKAQLRLVNISKELPKKNPEKELPPMSKVQERLLNAQKNEGKVKSSHQNVYIPPHRREKSANEDSWRKPMKDSSPSVSACNLKKKLQAQSLSHSLHEAMSDLSLDSQKKPQSVQPIRNSPQKTAPTIFYYQAPQARQDIDKFSSSLQKSKKTEECNKKRRINDD